MSIADIAESDWYGVGAIITFCLVFVTSWIYCIATYGFLFGVGLGWLPSLIVGGLAALLWPLLVVLIVIAIIYFSTAR
jgi:hypothetical protein